MTEGYPPQWQNDVKAGTGSGQPSGRPDEGRHGVAGFGEGASTPEVSYYSGSDGTATDPSGSSKTDAAKEQASAVGQGAAKAGQQVASVAKDQAQNVVSEAGSQAKGLLDQARSEVTDQAGAQQQRLAQGLRALGDELQSMSQNSTSPGVATNLAKQAATRSHDAASWLESREPGGLVTELQGFARRRPGAFLALAAGAGLMAGRLGRGVKDSTSDDTSSSTYGSTPPATGGYPSGYAATTPAPGYTPTPGYTPPTNLSTTGSGTTPSSSVGDYPGFGAQESRPFSSSQDAGLGDYPAGGAAR